MKEVTARAARLDEAPQLVEWIHAHRHKNGYDPDIFKYDSTRVLAVEKDGEPIVYLPFQFTVFIDALAPKPGLSDRDRAAALKAATHYIVGLCNRSGIGELYFTSADEPTVEFAKKHGCDEVKGVHLMRLKPRKMRPALPTKRGT